MKKFHVFGLALVAVFAMSVVVASAANAEVALWLHKGEDITTGTLATESSGALQLADLKAPFGTVKIECSGILDGTVGAAGVDTITDVLTLAGVLNTGDLLECSFLEKGACEGTVADVVPLGLPWATQLELSGEGFIDKVLPATAGNLGYTVTCKTLLSEKTEDTCTQVEATQTVTNVTGGVEGVSAEENTANCSLGGNLVGDNHGKGLTTLVNKEALTVSMP